MYSHVPAREASYPCIGFAHIARRKARRGRAEKDASTALEDEEKKEDARTREEGANRASAAARLNPDENIPSCTARLALERLVIRSRGHAFGCL